MLATKTKFNSKRKLEWNEYERESANQNIFYAPSQIKQQNQLQVKSSDQNQKVKKMQDQLSFISQKGQNMIFNIYQDNIVRFNKETLNQVIIVQNNQDCESDEQTIFRDRSQMLISLFQVVETKTLHKQVISDNSKNHQQTHKIQQSNTNQNLIQQRFKKRHSNQKWINNSNFKLKHNLIQKQPFNSINLQESNYDKKINHNQLALTTQQQIVYSNHH